MGVFLKAVSGVASANMSIDATAAERRQVHRALVRDHHQQYDSLPADATRVYQAQRNEAVAEKLKSLAEDIAYAEAGLELHQERQRQENIAEGWAFRTTSFPFTTTDHDALDIRWNSAILRRSTVEDLRAKATAPP